MTSDTIGFIGGGNMATSLIGGLIANGYPPAHLWASDPLEGRRRELESELGIHTTPDNDEVVAHADTAVLAVKPQVMAEVVRGLAAAAARRRPLVVSIAAGVREPDIRRWLGFEAAIVRSMPNTPALVGSGASGLYANRLVRPAERDRAESILRAVGVALWVEDEALLDAVTALSGSGPAYFFLLMELMAESGRELGLGAEAARLLTLQTAFGAAKMALESPQDPATLRARVTSPGGTTERALDILERGGVRTLVREALRGARDRADELGRMLGDK